MRGSCEFPHLNFLVSCLEKSGQGVGDEMHILLVEDDLKLTKVVRRILEEDGQIVDTLADGAEADLQVRMETYDLLLLDVMLPNLSGFDLVRRLRNRADPIPVLMLTARDSIQDRVSGLDAGADDYLVKPFALSELLARVRALGRRPRTAMSASEILRVGDLGLDTSTRMASRGGQDIVLTTTEYQLLQRLMRAPGRVFTRTELLELVWNLDSEISSNVVDTYIHYLRRKIDQNNEVKLIQTVRGSGYRIYAG